MTNEDPNAPVTREPSRRSPRQGIGGSPMGSTISIVLAVVAVIVGFLILNNLTDDGPSDSGVTEPVDSAPDDTTGVSTETSSTTSTEPALVTAGATVVVANASGVGGSAGRMSTELATVGFTMVDPAINSTQSGLTASIVQYDPSQAAAKDVADSVARSMGGLAVETVPTPPPVVGGSLNGAGVLVLLGTDQADKTIAQMTAPVSEVTPPPSVAGDTTTDTTGDTTG